jgi:hypothetical protein
MNRRIAKKIVQSCESGNAHYTPTQIQIAHQIMGREQPKPLTIDIKRAHGKDGHFVSDDPATPATNEAWVGGASPVEHTVKDLRGMAKEKGLSGYSKMKKDDLLYLLGL